MTTNQRPPFELFAPSNPLDLRQAGAEALVYVLKHEHTISISATILRFAISPALVAMHGRKSDDPIVMTMTRALDTINETIRYNDTCDQEEAAGSQPAQAEPVPSVYDDRSQDPSSKVPTHPKPPTQPPQGSAVRPDFLDSLKIAVQQGRQRQPAGDGLDF